MAKGSNNSEAIKLQRESLNESKRQAKVMESMTRAQIEAAAAMELPAFEGAAPAPSMSSADVQQAGDDVRQKALRRQGLSKTVYAGAAA